MRVLALVAASPADRNKERNKLLKAQAPSLEGASLEERRVILRRRLLVLFGEARELSGSQLNDLYLRIFHENIRAAEFPGSWARLKDVLKELEDTFAIVVAPMGQMSVRLHGAPANVGGPGLGPNHFLPAANAAKAAHGTPQQPQGEAAGRKIRSPPTNAVRRPCWQWPRCKFGDTCLFAHGSEELAEWNRLLNGGDKRVQGNTEAPGAPSSTDKGHWRCGADNCGHSNAPGTAKCAQCGRQAEAAWEARLTTFSKEVLGYLVSHNLSDEELALLPDGVSVELKDKVTGPLPPVLHRPALPDRGVVAAYVGNIAVEWTVRVQSRRPLRCARVGLLLPNLRQWRLTKAEGRAEPGKAAPINGISRGEANTYVFDPPLALNSADRNAGYTLELTVRQQQSGRG